jgi:hypothetical protein
MQHSVAVKLVCALVLAWLHHVAAERVQEH